MIIDDYSTKNAGGVTISEMHGATMADMDGDKIPDFVTGKRLFSHQESWVDPDPHGEAVLYWFRTVRNPKSSGRRRVRARVDPQQVRRRLARHGDRSQQRRQRRYRDVDQSRHVHLLGPAPAMNYSGTQNGSSALTS